jgi:hypothetical protein
MKLWCDGIVTTSHIAKDSDHEEPDSASRGLPTKLPFTDPRSIPTNQRSDRLFVLTYAASSLKLRKTQP